MVKLGDLVLPSDLVWENEFSANNVLTNIDRAINGDMVIFEQYASDGLNIDLVAYEDSGWLTREQVEQLYAMSQQANAVFVLEYHNSIFTVRFRHEDAPVLELDKLISTAGINADDIFIGRIKLKEV